MSERNGGLSDDTLLALIHARFCKAWQFPGKTRPGHGRETAFALVADIKRCRIGSRVSRRANMLWDQDTFDSAIMRQTI